MANCITRRLLIKRIVWIILICVYTFASASIKKNQELIKSKSDAEGDSGRSTVGYLQGIFKKYHLANCTPPAIEEFPKPNMGPQMRRRGGIVFHVFICLYALLGLAIVCDEYFIVALDRICDELKISPDVAGATFMAAGASAPELAIAIIGVFFAKDDIGLSGVIGSAFYNVLFIVSLCALLAKKVVFINWWPLCRDSFFYGVSILALMFAMYDGQIKPYESGMMVSLYVTYCILLGFNSKLEKWAYLQPLPCNNIVPILVEQEYDKIEKFKRLSMQVAHPDAMKFIEEKPDKIIEFTLTENEFRTSKTPSIISLYTEISDRQERMSIVDYQKMKYSLPTVEKEVAPLVVPRSSNTWVVTKWILLWPLNYMFVTTMPSCRLEKYKNWYPYTFIISIVWVSVFSYTLVWMIVIIGATLNIPDSVMGLTFVAAGVSVPDTIASLAVIREGFGDMAMSNAVGSNVFDVLICLGLPWLIQTTIVAPGTSVAVYSKGLLHTCMALLSTVIILITMCHLNGWRLDKKLGVILMVLYIIYISFSSVYEMNVFAYVNPPQCPSDY